MKITPCFNLKMRQANRVLTNHYDAYLRSEGLTVAQFSIIPCASHWVKPIVDLPTVGQPISVTIEKSWVSTLF